MTDPLEILADRMVGSRTIGFVGAGASVRQGLPTWNALIRELYRRARPYQDVPEPASTQDLRWLAEVYGDVIRDHSSLQDALREIFRDYRQSHPPAAREPQRLHDLMARLPFKHFITTNYDKLVEDACDGLFETVRGRRPSAGERCLTRDGRVSDSFSDFLGSFSQDTHRSVLHLHGTLEGENLTLSLGDYDVQYLHDAMLLRMFSVFATSTVVFIGASLQDADLMELVRRSNYHTGNRKRHYAFLTDDRRHELGMLRHSYGIEPIFYSAGVDQQHEELDRCMERILELVEPRRARPAPQASGNARPVEVRYGDAFEGLVNRVKDEVRRVRRGLAKIDGPSEIAASRVLRRVASDYRELPISYRFHHVVWISPGRIGLFPGNARSRNVLHSIVGEVVYALGRHRVTGTSDTEASIQAIRRVLEGQRWKDAEPVLFVIDGFEDLAAGSPLEPEEFREFFSFLPRESVALYRWPSDDDSSRTETDLIDAFEAAAAFEEPEDREEPAWARPVLNDEIRLLLEGDESDLSAAVLAALCVVATPIATEELALMLDLSRRDLDTTLHDLARIGLIEGDFRDEPGVPGRIGTRGRSGAVGVLNPIRRDVLEDPSFREDLASVIAGLLRWAEATVEGLSNWEEDNAQLDQLTRHLPNVLTVFEACCWLTSVDPRLFDQGTVDRHLWLGTDFAYILYNVGRWAEAEQILEYLRDRADGRIQGLSADVTGPMVSEPDTFLREVLILQSRYYEHAGTSEDDFRRALTKADEALDSRRALTKADEAIRNADERLLEGDPLYEPGANTYAPNRLTLARQRARAEIARGLALLKMNHVDDAALQLRTVLEDRAFDGDNPTRRKERESLLIVADAARALGAVRMSQLKQGPRDRSKALSVFRELDAGREAVEALRNRRARGHNALRRGDILHKLGNVIAARRYYARALLTAIEFRDRFLEAGAILGLATCDRDPALAERSRVIYEDLGIREKETEADVLKSKLGYNARVGVVATYPRLIPIVGIPGSGKSVVTRTVGSALAEWGYEPVIRTEQLIELIRSGGEVDLSEVQTEIIKPMEDEIDGADERVVGIVKIPTGRLGDLFRPWLEDRALLERILCIRMHAAPEVLRARNAQRRSGQLPSEVVEQMIDDYEKQDLERPALSKTETPESADYASWATAFQVNGGAMASVDSAGSILALESRVRIALGLSYLPGDELMELGEAEGSTG